MELIDNYNNYPDQIVNLATKIADILHVGPDRDLFKNKNIIRQSVYDVISEDLFDNFIQNGESERWNIKSDDDAVKKISLIMVQYDLLHMEGLGLIESVDKEHWTLTALGKSAAEDLKKTVP